MIEGPRKAGSGRDERDTAGLSQEVMDSFSDAVYIIDVRNYRVLACNAAFLEKHGLTESEVMGRPCYELTHHLAEPCNDAFDICPLKETLCTGRHSRAEHIHFLVSGERVYEEVSTSPIFEENGEILKVVSVARDITARRRAEEALKRATEFSRTVMESISDAVSIVDVSDYRVLGFNTAFLKKVGLTEAEATGRPCYELTHRRSEPCIPPFDVCPLVETVRTGTHSMTEHVHILGNGEKVYAEVSTSPIFDENGNIVKVVHVARNITERKEMEEALIRATEFSRTVMESIGDAVSIIDVDDWRVLGCNAAFLKTVGLTESEALGRPCYELTHRGSEPCAAPFNVCPLGETVRTGAHSSAEHVHFLGNGGKMYVEVSTLPVFNDNGRVIKVVHVARNITERKEMEEALLASELKFRGLAEKALVGVYIIQDDVFLYVNPKFAETFGYGEQELIGRMGPGDLTHPDDWPTVVKNLRQRINGEEDSSHYEFRGVTKEKGIIELEVYGNRVMYQDKPAVIGTLLDITERKLAERVLLLQARQLEQLALIDELTGLYNRRGFHTIAAPQLKTAQRLETGALLIFADLDGLKEINDVLGHQEGDDAIREAASLLRDTFRESDVIARLGGDEFVILAMSANLEGEGAIVSRIEKNLVRINAADNRRYSLSLSVGIACYDPTTPCSIDELIERADAQMYTRKSTKKVRRH